MNPSLTFILVGVIIFAAHLVAGVTGFGSAVLGLPLLALVVGLDAGKQSLLILTSLMQIYLVLRWPRHIDWRQLAIMVALAGVGVPIGIYLYARLPHRAAIIALGLFVAAVGLRNLLQLWPDQRAPRWLAKFLLIVGGVVHGAFTTGGPLLVVYADQTLRDKSTFRATLCVMWLALNALLVVAWTRSHAWTPDTTRLTLLGLPFMIGGLIVGEHLHQRTSEAVFRRAVSATLFAVGLLLLLFPAG